MAVVTGAANGLGRAEARALAQAGASLVLNDLPGSDLDAVCREAGACVAVAGDVGEWSTGERLVAAALEAYGRLDILVNNAGVLRDRMIFSMSARGVGHGAAGAPARALRDHALRDRVLAGGSASRRAGRCTGGS